MKRLILSAALAYGCTQERAATDTIAPAAPRPAPTSTAAIPDRPPVTTSGSPPPVPAVAPGTTLVQIERDGIDMRKFLPQGHTVFHIDNRTGQAHRILLQGASGAATAEVAPNGRTIIQLRLGPGRYHVSCNVPGHGERAAFDTYVAGQPLDITRGTDTR